MRLVDIFNLIHEGQRFPAANLLPESFELPIDLLQAICTCMAKSAVASAPSPPSSPRPARRASPPPPTPYNPMFPTSAAAAAPYDPWAGSSSSSSSSSSSAAAAAAVPPAETLREAGCVLALRGEDEIVLSAIKTGKAHSVSLGPGEAPPDTFFFGTLHSHPLDEHYKCGTPNSDGDFDIFKANPHIIVQLVATGIFKPHRVSDVFMLVRTSTTNMDFDSRFYDAMMKGHMSKLLQSNQPATEEIQRWAAAEAARFATWAFAKKFGFALYQGHGEGGLNRIDNKDIGTLFSIGFRRL